MRLNVIILCSFTLLLVFAAATYAPIYFGSHVDDEQCRSLGDGQDITERGLYCLSEDVQWQKGLTVKADFVTIDLRGHVLSSPAGQYGTVGVKVHASNSRITNGQIVGFGLGIQTYSDPHDRNLGFHQVDGVTISGSSQGGIHIIGGQSRILNNTIKNIGGGPLLPGVHTHGIYVSGPGAIVQGNRFENIYGADIAEKTEGIALAMSGYVNGALIINNTFRNDSILPEGQWIKMSPSTYAVWLGGNGLGTATVIGNNIINYVNGVIADYHMTAVIVGNQATNVAIPFSTRDDRRRFGTNIASGADGYIPADEGNSRPFGAAVKSGNGCDYSNDVAERLSKLKSVTNCIGVYDISFDELMANL
jgi:hypothetical protein